MLFELCPLQDDEPADEEDGHEDHAVAHAAGGPIDEAVGDGADHEGDDEVVVVVGPVVGCPGVDASIVVYC